MTNERIKIGTEIYATPDPSLRGTLVRYENDGFIAMVSTERREEFVPIGDIAAVEEDEPAPNGGTTPFGTCPRCGESHPDRLTMCDDHRVLCHSCGGKYDIIPPRASQHDRERGTRPTARGDRPECP